MKKIINKIMFILFIFGITLCGLTNSVHADTNGGLTNSVHADVNISKDRIYGNDRIQTSIKISQSGWANGTDTAVIAQGYGYADALCAGPLAKKYNAPILLSAKSGLNNEAINELKRLKVKKVFIIGESGVLSQNVESQLSSAGIKNIDRLGGKDRYETSLKVAETLGTVDSVVIASGNGYADSLSISSIAAQKGMPILLSEKDKLTDNIQFYIKKINAKKCYIIGGTGVISDNVKNLIPNSERLGGKDRFETNLSVIKNFQDELNFENIFIAEGDGPTGTEFADALSGSALAAQKSSPIILVYKNMATNTAQFIKTKMSDKTKLTALGGTSVVADNILNAVVDIYNGKTPTSGIGDIISPTTAAGGAAASTGKTDGKTFNMTITKNNGASTIKTFTMIIDKDKTKENAMEYLKSVTKITQLQGPGFINGIDGLTNVFLKDLPISDRQKGYYGIDWFICLNGTLTDVGAPGVYPKAGDTLNFDYHEWDWHALVAPGETVMPLKIEDVPKTVNVGQSIKLRVTCIYRGVYDVTVKVDGTKVASTDIDGYATITMNNSGTHKISVEKDTGKEETDITVNGGGPGPTPTPIILIQKDGNPNLVITETQDKVINIKSNSTNSADYISITLYDEKGNLSYMNQASNGKLEYNTFLKSGKYHGFIKTTSADIVNISEFQVN